MHQFFVDREQIGTEYITITGEDVKHIKNVLRMKEGEEVRISDGVGGDFFCTIEKVTSEEVLATDPPKRSREYGTSKPYFSISGGAERGTHGVCDPKGSGTWSL